MTNFFILPILYSQINIFCQGTPEFNDWSDEHVAQGFAWRNGHVSFGVPDVDGDTIVEVKQGEPSALNLEAADRAIMVAFSCDSKIHLATVLEDHALDMDGEADGEQFQLWYLMEKDYEYEGQNYPLKVTFYFGASDDPKFEILKMSDEMTSMQVLRYDTEIAQ